MTEVVQEVQNRKGECCQKSGGVQGMFARHQPHTQNHVPTFLYSNINYFYQIDFIEMW